MTGTWHATLRCILLILDEDWCVPPAPSAMHESLWERHSAVDLHSETGSEGLAQSILSCPIRAIASRQGELQVSSVICQDWQCIPFKRSSLLDKCFPESHLIRDHLREVQPAHACQIQVNLELQEEWNVCFVRLHYLPGHPSALQQLSCTTDVRGIEPAQC